MEKSLIVVTKVLTLSALTVILLYFTNVSFYKDIIKEDGIIENLTAILLLTMSILVLIRVVNLWKQKDSPWIVFNIFILLGLFFGFGEEISWGQRVFDITPSDFFAENNSQKETNIHNLMINGEKINKWILRTFFLFALALISFCYRWHIKKQVL